MNTIFNNLFLYDTVRELFITNDFFCSTNYTGPMASSTIKIHKGIDNKVVFRTLGPDRTPYNMPLDEQVYARIIDPDSNCVVMEKLCRFGPAKGVITLSIDSGDIALLHVGLYKMSMIRTENFVVDVPGYYIEKPMFTDMVGNINMEIEVTEQAFKAPVNSIIIDQKDWSKDLTIPLFGALVPSYYTKRIPGGRILNHINSVHTFSTYTKKFTGTLQLWGSLEEEPDVNVSKTRWFKIFPTENNTDIEFINYTGTQYWTFVSNVMWLKFVLIPSIQVLDHGVLERLIVRT